MLETAGHSKDRHMQRYGEVLRKTLLGRSEEQLLGGLRK